MKEQYQKEISQIHVPAELLEKTKAAMREEQEKGNSSKKSRVIPFKVISIAAAAAVLLLIAVPAASGNMRSGEAESADMQMHLSGQTEIQMQAIEPEKSWIEEIVDTIKDFFD